MHSRSRLGSFYEACVAFDQRCVSGFQSREVKCNRLQTLHICIFYFRPCSTVTTRKLSKFRPHRMFFVYVLCINKSKLRGSASDRQLINLI